MSESAWRVADCLAGQQQVTPSLFLEKVILGLSPAAAMAAFEAGVERETAARMAWDRGASGKPRR